jgi:hypothetical protein
MPWAHEQVQSTGQSMTGAQDLRQLYDYYAQAAKAAGEQFGSYDDFLTMATNPLYRQSFFEKLNSKYGSYKDGLKNLSGQVAPGSTPQDQYLAQFDTKWQNYHDQINKAFDPSSPYAQQVLSGAYNRASDEARLRGVEGPMSISNAQNAQLAAGHQLEAQRLGLLGNAVQGHSGFGMNKAGLGFNYDQFREGQRQYDQNFAEQRRQFNLNQQQQKAGPLDWIGGLASAAAPFVGMLAPGAGALMNLGGQALTSNVDSDPFGYGRRSPSSPNRISPMSVATSRYSNRD